MEASSHGLKTMLSKMTVSVSHDSLQSLNSKETQEPNEDHSLTTSDNPIFSPSIYYSQIDSSQKASDSILFKDESIEKTYRFKALPKIYPINYERCLSSGNIQPKQSILQEHIELFVEEIVSEEFVNFSIILSKFAKSHEQKIEYLTILNSYLHLSISDALSEIQNLRSDIKSKLRRAYPPNSRETRLWLEYMDSKEIYEFETFKCSLTHILNKEIAEQAFTKIRIQNRIIKDYQFLQGRKNLCTQHLERLKRYSDKSHKNLTYHESRKA